MDTERFQIHSTVRSVHTKHMRALSAERHRSSMLLGGGLLRVIRKRPTTVTRGMIVRLLPELMEREAKGMLMVTTQSGLRIDLATMKPIEGLPPVVPMPDPPMDSAANDENFIGGIGEGTPQFAGGLPPYADVPLPSLLKEEKELAASLEEPVVEEVPAPVTEQKSFGYNDRKRRR